MTGCWSIPSTAPWITKNSPPCSAAIASGGAKSIVRVGGYDDRPGIQQALDLGADGVLIPYINTAEEARKPSVAPNIPPSARARCIFRSAA
jgi:4-hydroxy-2-oxoheptanedioate aldolase